MKKQNKPGGKALGIANIIIWIILIAVIVVVGGYLVLLAITALADSHTVL